MTNFKSLLHKLYNDEQGSEAVEWVLLVALIALFSMLPLASIGHKAASIWTTLSDTL
jgi:Flp pilus assembly pilin Flp